MVQFKDVFLGNDKRPYMRATHVAALRARRRQAQRPRERRLHRAPPHVLRDAGQLQLRRLLQARRDPLRLGAADRGLQAAGGEALGHRLHRRRRGLRHLDQGDRRAGRAHACASATTRARSYASDNFWQMADTGPCGPCREIFYDHGPDDRRRPAGLARRRTATATSRSGTSCSCSSTATMRGVMHPLPKPCVDTGMGLERLAAVLQHVHSQLRDRPVPGADQGRGARDAATKDLDNQSLQRDRRPHPRLRLPDRRRRDPGQRRPRLRAAPDHPPRDPPRLQARRRRSRSSTSWSPDLVRADGRGLSGAARERGARHRGAEGRRKSASPRRWRTAWRSSSARSAGERARCSTARPRSSCYDTFGFPLDLTADIAASAASTVDEAGFDAAMERSSASRRARRGKFKMARGARVQRARRRASTATTTLARRRRKVIALYTTARRSTSSTPATTRRSWCSTTRRSTPSAAARSATAASCAARRRAVRRRGHAEDPGRRVRPPRRADDRRR